MNRMRPHSIPRPEHPTRLYLIQTVDDLLSTRPIYEIGSELVLAASGVSKGSLYHHFEDFNDLIEVVIVKRFSDYIQGVLDDIIREIKNGRSREIARDRVLAIAERQATVNTLAFRVERIQIAEWALRGERARSRIAIHQDQITQQWMDIFNTCQQKGWTDSTLDARTVGVLIQAAMMGRVVDDVAAIKMDVKEWVRTIKFLLDSIFFSHA